MTTQTFTLKRLDLSPKFRPLSIGQPTVADGTDDVEVKMVDIYGRVYRNATQLALVDVKKLKRTKGAPRGASLAWPKYAFSRDDLHVFTDDTGLGDLHEIQVYVGGVLQFWGPILQPNTSSDNGQVTAEAVGVDWYLNAGRFIDGHITNLVLNGDFEDATDFNHWTADSGITATIATDRHLDGTQAGRLVNATAGQDKALRQTFRPGSNGVGLNIDVLVRFYLESFTASAYKNRGIHIEARKDGVLRDFDDYRIDARTPRNQWVTAELGIHIPPDEIDDVTISLYPPQGTIVYDVVKAVPPYSTSTAGLTGTVDGEVDVADIVKMILTQVQDPASGWSGLRIGADTAATGILQSKHIPWVDHTAWDQQMAEWTGRDDTFEWDIELTPTTRRLKMYVPRKGTDWTGTYAFSFHGADPEGGPPADTTDDEISHYDFGEDGATVRTAATQHSDSDNPARDEATYTDASLTGGLTIKDVQTVPPGARLDSYLPRARAAVNRARKPAKMFTITIVDTANVGYRNILDVGDYIPITIDNGWDQADGLFEITEWELNPRQPRVLVLTVSEVLADE